MATDPANPAGCLWVQGALATSAESITIRENMVSLRNRGIEQIQARLTRARAEGDLPATADPEALTLYIISMMNGMVVQAAGGRSREALNKAAATRRATDGVPGDPVTSVEHDPQAPMGRGGQRFAQPGAV